jgi:hypothetical protein
MTSKTWVAPPVGIGSAGTPRSSKQKREALVAECLEEAAERLIAVGCQPLLEFVAQPQIAVEVDPSA